MFNFLQQLTSTNKTLERGGLDRHTAAAAPSGPVIDSGSPSDTCCLVNTPAPHIKFNFSPHPPHISDSSSELSLGPPMDPVQRLLQTNSSRDARRLRFRQALRGWSKKQEGDGRLIVLETNLPASAAWISQLLCDSLCRRDKKFKLRAASRLPRLSQQNDVTSCLGQIRPNNY